ncbi:hypothetical protein EP7_005329 [Isosphaeraceae bacterium EP7]
MRPQWRGVLTASALAALGIGALASLGPWQWLTAMTLMTMELMAGSLRGAWDRSGPGPRSRANPPPAEAPASKAPLPRRDPSRFRFRFRRPTGAPGPRIRPRRVTRRGRGGGFVSPA